MKAPEVAEPGSEVPTPAPPYQIGYGRPPAGGRFKKGKSGNPSGRPKGSKTLASLMKKYGEKTLTVQMQGRSQTLTYDELIVARLHAKAQAGDARALQYWLEWAKAVDAHDEPAVEGGGVIHLPAEEFPALDKLRAQEKSHG